MSHRTEQVAELVHRLVGEQFLRSLEFPEGTIATISRVNVTPDLRQANVFVTVYPFEQTQTVLGYLVRHRREIQQNVVEELTMRNVPKLMFHADSQTESASQIEAIMDQEMGERNEKV